MGISLQSGKLILGDSKMTDKIYHLALQYGKDFNNIWGNAHKNTTLILLARRELDSLPSDINHYIGQRIVTKKHLNQNKTELLQRFNDQLGTDFKRLVIG